MLVFLLTRHTQPSFPRSAWERVCGRSAARTLRERLASIGIVTANPEIARRQRITNIGAFVAAGTTLAHLAINAVHDAGGLVMVHIFNAVFALLALLTPSLHRYGENAAAIGLATLVLLGTVVIVWLLGTASHLQIYFTLIGALRKYGLKRGVASLCIGGGEATAMAIELA